MRVQQTPESSTRDVQEAGAAEETGLTLGQMLLHAGDNIPNTGQAQGTETRPATSYQEKAKASKDFKAQRTS